jgi:hypothetical protein
MQISLFQQLQQTITLLRACSLGSELASSHGSVTYIEAELFAYQYTVLIVVRKQQQRTFASE